MKRMAKIGTLLLILCLGTSCLYAKKHKTEEEEPLMMLRLKIENTITEEGWEKMLSAFRKHPGCCDEVWFSTGIGVPPMEVHRQHVERLLGAKEDLKELGIISSLQVQMTIGHGDPGAKPNEWTAKTWTGWTGSTGVEDKYCNCPRQTKYLEYIREMTRLYAKLCPRTLWIDDDLRYDNHIPATNNSRIGCWCDTCLAAFSEKEGVQWNRQTLDKAMDSDPALADRWKQFCIESLQEIARIISQETRSISPTTKMGYQKTFFDADTTVVRAILKTLAETSGQKVSYRPGGGAYYDKGHAANQIVKSMHAARFMRLMGCPDEVDIWCPEIESYPRHYGSRTAQSVLLEGFAALAYGMDAVSMFVTDPGEETPELKARSMLGPLEEGAPTLREYARANKGTSAVGFGHQADARNSALYEFGLLGIPVLPGIGKSLGKLDEKELKAIDLYSQPSSDIQAFREKMSEGTEVPAICRSPFVGLMIPRIEEDGTLRTVGLLNSRIDRQGPIRLHLSSLPSGVKNAVWYELKKKPIKLKIHEDTEGYYVEVPQIDAWNAGFLKF